MWIDSSFFSGWDIDKFDLEDLCSCENSFSGVSIDWAKEDFEGNTNEVEALEDVDLIEDEDLESDAANTEEQDSVGDIDLILEEAIIGDVDSNSGETDVDEIETGLDNREDDGFRSVSFFEFFASSLSSKSIFIWKFYIYIY